MTSGYQPLCLTQGREYSDDTAKTIDEEIARILHDQERRARALLEKHRPALDAVSECLLERETMDGGEVASMVHETLGDRPVDNSVTVE